MQKQFRNVLDRSCCFSKRQAVRSHKLLLVSVVVVDQSTTKWPQSHTPVKNCCVITISNGRSVWTRVAKWKALIMGRGGLCGSCGKKASRQICGERALGHSTVFSWVQSFTSDKETTQAAVRSGTRATLKNGSVKPSRSSQRDGNRV